MKKEIKRKSLLFWLALLGSLCIGEVFGAMHARILPEEILSETETILSDAIGATEIVGKKVFLSNLAARAKWVIPFYLCGLFRWTTPAAFLLMGGKGYLIGFAATFLLRKGHTALFLYLIVPAMLVEIPCLFAIARLGNLHAARRRCEPKAEGRRDLFRTYTAAMAVLFLILVGESVLEGCILPAILGNFNV